MTPKQKRFIDEYLIDCNATQAAIRAGYSLKTARQIGDELLSKPDIASAVADRMEQRAAQTGIDAAWVLKEAREVYMAAKDGGQLPAALRALEIVGKHVDVQAFRDRVDHNLAMRPEEARAVIDRFMNARTAQ